MAGREFVANPNNMQGLSAVVYDAAAVPEDLWPLLQRVHRAEIQSHLPAEEWGRADEIVSWRDPKSYQATRVKPQLMVGNGWNDFQTHKKPQVVVILDGSSQVVGGGVSSLNSSAKLLREKPGWQLETWAKMHVPPGLKMSGKIGGLITGKGYIHYREGYSMPGVQEKLHADDIVEVSGILLAGMYHLLDTRHPDRIMAAYKVPEDPADGQMVQVSDVFDMKETDRGPNTLPGAIPDSSLVRVVRGIDQVMDQIVEMLPLVTQMSVDRVTKKSIKKAEKDERKRQEIAYSRELDGLWEDPR